jgi:hypothetical protein
MANRKTKNRLINKRGALNVLQVLSFVFMTMALTTGVGYMIGFSAQNYNTSFNTNVSGTDLTEASSFQNFINATNVWNTTPNGTYAINESDLTSGSESMQIALTGWWQILSDIIDITPLEQFGGFLKTLLTLIGGVLITLLMLQFIFNRTLTH